MQCSLYLKQNPDWDHENKIKFGYVGGEKEALVNRLNDSSEEHSEKNKFIGAYLFQRTPKYKLHHEIDKIFSIIARDVELIEGLEIDLSITLPKLKLFEAYLVSSKTKPFCEFMYKEGVSLLDEIIKEEFPLLGLELVKEYSKEEIKVINKSSRKTNRQNLSKKLNKFLEHLRKLRVKKYTSQNYEIDTDKYEWIEREYQNMIINHNIRTLDLLNKIYLELATGAGKTYCVYKTIAQYMPETIIQFSPRKKINRANSSNKYLSLLEANYLPYNCSDNKDFNSYKKECKEKNKKMMIIACPQSSGGKVYDIITNNSISNIFIWFDEAHHTIENWVNKLDNEDSRHINFFLKDNTSIIKRIYTSASPDKDFVKENPNIFGEFYSPIKVNELMKQKYLCPIKVKILEEDIPDYSLVDWIISNFVDAKKHFGFSFHSRDNNAFNLFNRHYEKYIEDKTIPKPFLLINNDGLNEANKNKLLETNLDYDFRNDEIFEKTENSIGYVVKKYDMGYDFQGLDYIVMSIKDFL